MRLASSLILATALALAACGDNGGNKNTAAPTTAAAQSPERAKAMAIMPPFAPLYPGAEVQSSLGGSGGPEAAGTVTFASKDAPGAVIDFYRGTASKAGLMEADDAGSDNDAVTYSAQAKDGMTMRVIARAAGDTTIVQVVWGRFVPED